MEEVVLGGLQLHGKQGLVVARQVLLHFPELLLPILHLLGLQEEDRRRLAEVVVG